MKKLLLLLILIIFGQTLYIVATFQTTRESLPVPKPLLVYSFENLKKSTFPKSQIQLGEKVSVNTDSFSQMFYFSTPKNPKSQEMQNVSGLMNAPAKSGTYPVVVMIRGFVPQSIYTSGIGTNPVAKMLAKNGFITLAPDFLGYGKSASGAADTFENRFQTYTTVLSLFASLPTLNTALDASYSGTLKGDLSKVGLWGHSNGGHIVLSTLVISGVSYPTVLWAPVSASFPYSILYYTDEANDHGKILRKILAQFENTYDTDIFSPSNYYNWIHAPIDIEQGTSDIEVPYWWSDSLAATLKKDSVSVIENIHSGADHNMLPASLWNNAVDNTIAFYKNQLK